MDQIMLEHSSITQGPWDHSDFMLIFMMKSRSLTDAGESSFCAIFKRADVCGSCCLSTKSQNKVNNHFYF